jgi:hypothetical protein
MSRLGNRRAAVAAPVVAVLRVAGSALLAAMAAIHLYLWSTGYDGLPWIGPLFLGNAVSGFVVGAAVLAVPRRLLGWVAAAGALLEAGTLAALGLTVWVGLFGFVESTDATLFWPSVVVETAGAVVLGCLVVVRPRILTGAHRAPHDDSVRADG